MDVQVLVRRGVDKDERTIAIERVEIDRLAKDRDDEKNILENNYKQNLINLFKNKLSNVSLDGISKGNKINESDIINKPIDYLEQTILMMCLRWKLLILKRKFLMMLLFY